MHWVFSKAFFPARPILWGHDKECAVLITLCNAACNVKLVPTASAMCSTMAFVWGMNLPSSSSTGSCSNGYSARTAFAAHSRAKVVDRPRWSPIDKQIRTGLLCRPVLEVDAMVLEWHAGRREDEPWELAARANVKVVQFVVRHRRDLYRYIRGGGKSVRIACVLVARKQKQIMIMETSIWDE